MPNIKPFIRWAGGKTWLINDINKLISSIEINHYHEPFLGGGSVFFSLDLKKTSFLVDANQELIDTYIQIKTHPNEVIDFLKTLKNTESDYYEIRNNIYNIPEQRAAQFIYLNQTSYNGLYRVNRDGKYNVPYGFRKNWVYDYQRIIDASKKLQKSKIYCGDFELSKKHIQKNDLVFLDPPYTVSHNNNGFIEYNKNLFSLEDQKRLSSYIDCVKQKGAYYILTNAAHEKIIEIFDKNDRKIEVKRHSLIGGKYAKREIISEYIFTNITED